MLQGQSNEVAVQNKNTLNHFIIILFYLLHFQFTDISCDQNDFAVFKIDSPFSPRYIGVNSRYAMQTRRDTTSVRRTECSNW